MVSFRCEVSPRYWSVSTRVPHVMLAERKAVSDATRTPPWVRRTTTSWPLIRSSVPGIAVAPSLGRLEVDRLADRGLPDEIVDRRQQAHLDDDRVDALGHECRRVAAVGVDREAGDLLRGPVVRAQ